MPETAASWLAGILFEPPAAIVMALHILVAGRVSVHVLMRKRDVGSAIGWIGLAWLSPFIGGSLYWLLGINRVRRRAQDMREPPPRPDVVAEREVASERDDHLAPLDRAAAQITGRVAVDGNKVTPLRNGDEAYPPMLAAIDAARSSIALSSYILRDDAAGGPLIDALVRAHARHVAVRVIIDGIGGGYFGCPAFRRLRREGVPAARFMHSFLPWRMAFLNLRMHKKILVADGREAFTGGINIGQENVVALAPRHPVLDSHFAVTGPVVGQIVEAFANDWLLETGETLSGPDWFPALTETGQQTARVVTAGPDQDIEKIEFVTMMAITCAQRSITVMTPYFLPDDRLVSALTLAALRGVTVDLIVPAQSDHPLVDFATREHIGPLVRVGCRVWKNPGPFEHSKLMVVDGAWALIGSSNWDVRSFRLNFELNLEIYSADLAQVLRASMLRQCVDPLTAAELALRPLPIRLRDAGLRLLLPYL